MSKAKNKVNRSIAFSYDPITFKYTGKIECWESPREPGVYLQPEFSTYVPPLTEKDGHDIYWNNESNTWYYKLNYVNRKVYDIRDGSSVTYPREEDNKYYTELAPTNQYCFWNDNKWELDVKKIKTLILPLIATNGLIYNYFLNGPIVIPEVGVINGNSDTLAFLKDVREMLTNQQKDVLDKFRMYDNNYRALKLDEVFSCIFILQRSLMEDKIGLAELKDNVIHAKNMEELNKIEIRVPDDNKVRRVVIMEDVIQTLIAEDEVRLCELFSFR